MSYNIKNVVQVADSINTDIEYTLSDSSIVDKTISHFQPKDKDTVITGIENMEATLEQRLSATINNATIVSQLLAN